MEKREFYKRFQTLQGEGFLVRSKRDVRVARGIVIGGMGMALVGILFFSGVIGQLLLALGFCLLGAAAAQDASIRQRVAVWPLMDAVIDWKKVDEQIGSGS